MALTPGKLLLKKALPEDLHSFLEAGPLDKGRINQLMKLVQRNHPDKYKNVMDQLHKIGNEVAATYGGKSSLTPESFIIPPKADQARLKLREQLNQIEGDPSLSNKEKTQAEIETLKQAREGFRDAVREGLSDTAIGLQMRSGSRGNPDQALSLVAGDLLTPGPDGEPLPVPITRGYAEGLTPSQYWAKAQKSRLGLIGTKLATPKAGDLANQLVLAARRLRVTQPEEPHQGLGIPVDPSDTDYQGAILSQDVGDIAKAGDELTPHVVREANGEGIDEVIVHSPVTSSVPYGLSQEAVGYRNGELPGTGSFIGVDLLQSLTERLSQTSIGSKHKGQASASGLDQIYDLVSAPKHFAGQASVAHNTGYVKDVHELPTGAVQLRVGDEEHVIEPTNDIEVDEGDRVERGDIISTGIPNPKELVKYRGIGAGRKAFAERFSNVLEDSGISHNKRNAEAASRALINHVRATEPFNDWTPGDLVHYDTVAREWEPRESAETVSPQHAVGRYLEKPALYYSIGTKLTRNQTERLKKHGVEDILVNKEPPPFEPEMRRGFESKQHSPSWLERLSGYYRKRGLLDAVSSPGREASPSDPTDVVSQMLLEGQPRQLDI